MGDTLAGRLSSTLYQVEEQLGAGGVGAVYRVTQRAGGRSFALKVLHRSHTNSDALRKRFEREAQALGALSHPNIVAISDYGTANDEPYLVMELLEGESLSQRLQRRPLDAQEVRHYGGELLAALQYVHRQGLAHRDVKPGNVFLHRLEDGSYQAKVLDFGFVKFVEGNVANRADPLTRTGEMFGTPAYMPPEQIGGEQTNARTDVYALGVVLFEMVAGRRPFEGDPTDILRGHLVEEPPSLESACPGLQVCAGLGPLIARALKKRPDDRFADAGEMLSAFEALPDPLFGPRAESASHALAEASTVAEAEPRPPPERRATRSSPLAALRAWLSALWDRVVTAGAIALIVLSLAIILVSGVAIYGLRGEATGTAIERELAQRLPAVLGQAAPEAAPAGATAPSASARPEARNPWRRPMPPTLRKILRSVEGGGRVSERSIRALRTYNREHPTDALGHLLLAAAYWNRSWKEDALTQYELAAKIDPSVRGEPKMLGHLLGMLGESPTAERAGALIAELYGREALQAIDRALESPPEDAKHRARLLALHARLAGPQ